MSETGARMPGDPYGNLRAVFAPKTIAVIGASERPGSVGRAVFERLTTHGFEGDVVPVTPAHRSILGRPTYSTIVDAPKGVDLAVIATPAKTVPGIARACAIAGVKGVVIISAGFRETGPAGAALEQQLLEIARETGMRIVGPNCLGIVVPSIGLDATFAAGTALPGSIGFVSQSGALCTAILDWAATRDVGFSCFVSAGSMVDAGWSDYLDLLVDDSRTSSILLYMESVGSHPPSFVSSLREAAAQKPVIVMKSGRSEAAARAAASHTGALLGSDAVFDAAIRRCGALRVDRIADLFNMADVLSKGNRPRGKRLAIVTNAGGPGVIASDALIAAGGELAPLAAETREKLGAELSGRWSGGDPIDIYGDADPERFGRATRIALDDPTADAVLVVFAPQAIAPPAVVAEGVASAGHGRKKPLLAAWMGGASVAPAVAALERGGVPTYAYPESAVAAFNYLWSYDENLDALYETPTIPSGKPNDRDAARRAIASAREAGRDWLSGEECSAVAAAYDLPAVASAVALTADEAERAAHSIGYPVAVKLRSSVLVHKTDIGGVRLDIADAAGARAAFGAIRDAATRASGESAFEGVVVQPMIRTQEGVELILGSAIDEQFGPVIAFGLGGVLVEVLHDSELALPPLNATLARRLISRTQAFKALGPIRGRRPVDVDALAGLVARFSDLVVENPELGEIDVNPLFASADRIVALDVRMRLIPAGTVRPRPAIRPYPSAYVRAWTAPNGETIDIRPIRAEDEPRIREFHRTLSDTSVYMRYGHLEKAEGRMAHSRLARSCFIDYGREIALVAEAAGGTGRIYGIGNLVRSRSPGRAEFALLVADDMQGHGLGTELLRRLIETGRDDDIRVIVGYVLPSNVAMLDMCSRLGFRLRGGIGGDWITTVLETGGSGLSAVERSATP